MLEVEGVESSSSLNGSTRDQAFQKADAMRELEREIVERSGTCRRRGRPCRTEGLQDTFLTPSIWTLLWHPSKSSMATKRRTSTSSMAKGRYADRNHADRILLDMSSHEDIY